MNETKRTWIYIGVAALSVGAASVTHYVTRPKPDAESTEVGTQFYPEFQDPTTAQVLRVVAFDNEHAAAKEFKVEYRDGKWRIPSHHNYSADGKDRLARTAASIIGTKRGAFVTRRKSEHAQYKVVDPEDRENESLQGRGDKLTLSRIDGTVLAEYIVGKKAEGQNDVYYVRCPKGEDADAVYLARLKIDLSTKFADWIEPDLLKVDRDNLNDVRIDAYTIDEQQGVLVPGEKSELTRKLSADPWKLEGMKDNEELKTEVVNQLVNSIDGLRIVGVRPKDQGVNPDLSLDAHISKSPQLVMALRERMAERGFFIASDRRGGKTRIVSKEGEVEAGTNQGVRYALHFGQIFTGSEFEIETGLAKAGGKEEAKGKEPAKETGKKVTAKDAEKKDSKDDKTTDQPKKSRYLMVYATFDPALVGAMPVKPIEPKKPDGLVLDSKGAEPPKSPANPLQPAKKTPLPASGDASKAASPPKPVGKQSSIGRLAGEMLALADPNDNKKPDATGSTKQPSPAAKPSPTGKPLPAADSKPADGKKTPGPKPALPPKPDPKVEYQKAMDQYKKDLERYENDKAQHEKKLKEGKEKVAQLNERFGPWYYVISAESFENLRLARTSLVKPKEKPADKKDAAGEPKPPLGHPALPPLK